MNAGASSQPRAKKSLGQHFLKTPAISERIAALLHPSESDRIVEIGPGPGALTEQLRIFRPAQLLLIEKDDHWAAHHAALADGVPGHTVLHQDALAFDWTSLEGPWKITGNLPYNIASPLMWDIVSRTPALARAVFMIQKEVADRLRAAPGGRDYGALSVWVQSFVRVEWGFTVGPGHFAPPPKVDSAVVAFAPLARRGDFDPDALALTLRVCFQQRRKQLQSLLRKQGLAAVAEALPSLGIDPAARPETLITRQFHALSALVAAAPAR